MSQEIGFDDEEIMPMRDAVLIGFITGHLDVALCAVNVALEAIEDRMALNDDVEAISEIQRKLAKMYAEYNDRMEELRGDD